MWRVSPALLVNILYFKNEKIHFMVGSTKQALSQYLVPGIKKEYTLLHHV